MNRKKKIVLKLHNEDGTTTEIGSWKPANQVVDNFDDQGDIGWHIFYGFVSGAKKIEVIEKLDDK